MQDKQYAAFQAKLTPEVPMESFIGIRVPVLHNFAKVYKGGRMQGISSAASSRILRREHASWSPHFRGKGLRGMHSSYREIPAIRGQLGCLRHHVSEGVCQTQEGAINENQDLE